MSSPSIINFNDLLTNFVRRPRIIDNDLSLTELQKRIFCEVLSYVSNGQDFYLNNTDFAKLLHVSRYRLIEALKDLIKNNYLATLTKDCTRSRSRPSIKRHLILGSRINMQTQNVKKGDTSRIAISPKKEENYTDCKPTTPQNVKKGDTLGKMPLPKVSQKGAARVPKGDTFGNPLLNINKINNKISDSSPIPDTLRKFESPSVAFIFFTFLIDQKLYDLYLVGIATSNVIPETKSELLAQCKFCYNEMISQGLSNDYALNVIRKRLRLGMMDKPVGYYSEQERLAIIEKNALRLQEIERLSIERACIQLGVDFMYKNYSNNEGLQ